MFVRFLLITIWIVALNSLLSNINNVRQYKIMLTTILIAIALIAGVVAGFVIANSRLNQSSVQAKENLIKKLK